MSADDVLHQDVCELLNALGLGAHARPYSVHEVMQREILPAVRTLVGQSGAPASALMPYSKCDGCGRIATDDEGTPWTFWENLPVKSAAAVMLGLVRPVTCPACSGSGSVAA